MIIIDYYMYTQVLDDFTSSNSELLLWWDIPKRLGSHIDFLRVHLGQPARASPLDGFQLPGAKSAKTDGMSGAQVTL